MLCTKKPLNPAFSAAFAMWNISDASLGISVWKYPLIDQDTVLNELNQTARQLFDSYYEFGSHDEPCWFNHEKEKAEKNTMIELISLIKKRLDEINDGSFVVEDLETERLKNL